MLLERLIVEIAADTRGLNQGVDQANTRLGGLAKGAKLAGAAVAGVVGVEGIRRLNDLVTSGGRAENMMRAFERRTGEGAAGMQRLQAATRNLIPVTQLLEQANTALALGSAKSVDQVAELASVSLDLSRVLGIDAAFALNSLNTGIARQSKLYLDNLGIIISVEEANERYAKSIGKATAELTDLEKREAFRAEALRKARGLIDDFGGSAENNADKVDRLVTSVKNLESAAARLAANNGLLGETLDFWAEFLNMASGEAIGADATYALTQIGNLGQRSNILTLQQDLERFAKVRDTVLQTMSVGGSIQGVPNLQGAADAYQSAIRAFQQRLVELAGDGAGGEGGDGLLARTLGFTNENAARLKAAIADAEQALTEARFERSFTADAEAAAKLDDEIGRLITRLGALKRARDSVFGGRAGLDLLSDSPGLPGSRLLLPQPQPGMRLPDLYPTVPVDTSGAGGATTDALSGFDKLAQGMGASFDRLFDPTLIGSQVMGSLITSGMGMLGQGLVGLFGESEEERARRQEGDRITKENTRALRDLTENIGTFVRSQTGAEFTARRALIPGLSDLIQDGLGLNWDMLERLDPESLNAFIFDRFENALGIDDIEQMAADVGVTLSAISKSAFKESFTDFLEALQTTTAGLQVMFSQFGSGYSLLQTEFDLFDIQDPTEQFQRVIDFLADFVDPDFAKELQGLTPSTFDDWLADWWEQVRSGGFDPSLLGEGLGFDDFLSVISFLEGAFDGLADAANTVSGALYNVPQGFKYARAVYEASDPMPREILRTDREGAPLPDSTGITLNFGDLHFGPDVSPQAARQFVRELGREVGRGGHEFRRVAARAVGGGSGVQGY